MQIILVKLTLYVTEKSNNFHPVPAGSTASPCPTITGLFMQCYNNVQTEWQLYGP